MSRLFGQALQSGVGLLSRMSKVDTDEGLGPGSEDRRRELLDQLRRLVSRSKLEPGALLDKSADSCCDTP